MERMESVAESRSEPGELSGKRTGDAQGEFHNWSVSSFPAAEELAKALSDLPAVPKIILLAANESLSPKVTDTSKVAGRGDSGGRGLDRTSWTPRKQRVPGGAGGGARIARTQQVRMEDVPEKGAGILL